MTWYKKIGIYVLSGLLLGVGFVVPLVWPLGILGAGLLLHRLLISKDSWGEKLFGAYSVMFIKFLFVLAFYWTMYPIEWLPFDFGSGELAIIALYWISVALYLACSGFVLYGLIFCSRKIGAPNWILYSTLVPISWIASEVFGSFSLSVFTLGPGSEPNISFSLGYFGYLLGEHHLLAQIARLGGVYALSFVSVLVAVYIAYKWSLWGIKQKRVLIAILLIFAATTNIPFSTSVTESEMETIALISTTLPVENLFIRQDVEWHKNVQEEAIQAAFDTKPKYVLWPEDARYFSQLAGGMGISVFSFLHADKDTVVIDTGVEKTTEGRVARANIVDLGNNKNYLTDKRYLVPQGEFMPYLYQEFFKIVGLGDMAAKVAEVVSYVIGPETSQKDFPANIPGVLFCFESADANGVRSLMKERSDVPFIVHPVSHIWFHEPRSFWSQLDTSLRVQAIWNQVYIASAGNHSPSRLFTPTGNVIKPETVATGEYWSVGLVSVPTNK